MAHYRGAEPRLCQLRGTPLGPVRVSRRAGERRSRWKKESCSCAHSLPSRSSASCLTLAACSSGDGGDSSIRESTLSVSLMDAPVDGVTSVNVQIAAIWLKPQGGPAKQLALTKTPKTVDLLRLDDRNAAL